MNFIAATKRMLQEREHEEMIGSSSVRHEDAHDPDDAEDQDDCGGEVDGAQVEQRLRGIERPKSEDHRHAMHEQPLGPFR
jgi:hypothetical protein